MRAPAAGICGEPRRPMAELPDYLPPHTAEQVHAAVALARRGVPLRVLADQHGRVIDGRLAVDVVALLAGEGITVAPERHAVEVADDDHAIELRLALNCARRQVGPAERALIARRLRDERGWSTRRIAGALGVDQSTIVRDLRDVGGDADASPGRVKGTDGKSYPSRRRRPGANEATVTTSARQVARSLARLWRAAEEDPAGPEAAQAVAVALLCEAEDARGLAEWAAEMLGEVAGRLGPQVWSEAIAQALELAAPAEADVAAQALAILEPLVRRRSLRVEAAVMALLLGGLAAEPIAADDPRLAELAPGAHPAWVPRLRRRLGALDAAARAIAALVADGRLVRDGRTLSVPSRHEQARVMATGGDGVPGAPRGDSDRPSRVGSAWPGGRSVAGESGARKKARNGR
jgi:hypothetical protein